jgi:hypothetical protein
MSKRTPSPFWVQDSSQVYRLHLSSLKVETEIRIELTVWQFDEVFNYSIERSMSPDGAKKTLEDAQIAAEELFAKEFFADGDNREILEFLNSIVNNSSNS